MSFRRERLSEACRTKLYGREAEVQALREVLDLIKDGGVCRAEIRPVEENAPQSNKNLDEGIEENDLAEEKQQAEERHQQVNDAVDENNNEGDKENVTIAADTKKTRDEREQIQQVGEPDDDRTLKTPETPTAMTEKPSSATVLLTPPKPSSASSNTLVKDEGHLMTPHTALPPSSSTNRNTKVALTCYQDTTKCVFLAGPSGIGKSALVEHAFRTSSAFSSLSRARGPPTVLYGLGKYEQSRHEAKPYAALSMCLMEICDALLQTDHAYAASSGLDCSSMDDKLYSTRLRKALEPQELASIANTMAPNLLMLVGCTQVKAMYQTHRSQATGGSEAASGQESVEVLKYALRNFLVTVACRERPVVMCLDDLQWIDVPSLKLLQSIIKNSALHHFIFVGIYRDNEVGPDHAVSRWMNELRDPLHITLSGLTVGPISAMLQDALQVHYSSSREIVVESKVDEADMDEAEQALWHLSELLHNRTGGNAFHLLQLLDFLQAESLLTYSMSKFEWTWDLKTVQIRTSLSDNVATVVTAKIERLPPNVRESLILCSLLGYRFDLSALETAVKAVMSDRCKFLMPESTDEDAKEEDKDTTNHAKVCTRDGVLVTDFVDKLVREGLLDCVQGKVKFSHDRVFQAASEMQQDAAKLHFKIGKALWIAHVKDADLSQLDDKTLFLCVDQINFGQEFVPDRDHRLGLARLNLTACRRASALSAFVPASRYMKAGIDCLDPDTQWTDQYELTLEFYTLLAELSGLLDDTENICHARTEIHKHRRTALDSVRANVAVLQAAASKDRFEDVRDALYELLPELGVAIPKSVTEKEVNRRIEKLWKEMRPRSEDDIKSLPLMTKKEKLGAMQLLAVTIQLMATRRNFATLVVIMMMELTLEFGLSPHSPMCLSYLASIAASWDEMDISKKAWGSSWYLVEQPGLDTARPQVLVTRFGKFWTESLSKMTDIALESYTVAMRNGKVGLGGQSILQYASAYFYSGLPLGPFNQDLDSFISVMADYGVDYTLLLTLPFHLCASCLTGSGNEILKFDSEFVTQHRVRCSWNGDTGAETQSSLCMQIAFYCGELNLAAKFAGELHDLSRGWHSSLWVGQVRTFFLCLLAIWKAKRSLRWRERHPVASLFVRRKHRQDARRHYERVRHWVVDMKSINSAHKLMILDAEMKTLDKGVSMEELRSSYDAAIAASSRSGFVQDAALAAHLASRAILEEEEMYWERASELYYKWGARGVVEYVNTKSSKSESSTFANEEESGALRGRRRFDHSVVREHNILPFD